MGTNIEGRHRIGTRMAVALGLVAATLAGPASAVHADPPPDPTVTSGYGWGAGAHGQLGSGTTADALTPIPIQYPAGTTAIAAGREYTLAIVGTDVLAWGRGTEGQLGDGTSSTSLDPVRVALPLGVTPIEIAADDGHSLVLTSTGLVYAWGVNDHGQIGNGTHTDQPAPVQVPVTDIVAIGTGADHSLAVTSTGLVYAWGANADGQLGDGTTTERDEPVLAAVPGGVVITQVAGGAHHTIALAAGGSIYTWGEGADGQLGHGDTASSTTPQIITGGYLAQQVVAGDRHSAVLALDGGMFAWGSNALGQVGNGPGADRLSPVPLPLPLGVSFDMISTSANSTMAVANAPAGATVQMWGTNDAGQLGNGTTTGTNTPQSVGIPAGEQVRFADAGFFASLVIVQQGPLDRLELDPPLANGLIGEPQTFTVHGFDALDHDLGSYTAGISLSMTGGTCAGLVCTPAAAGTHTVTVTAGDSPPITATASLIVIAVPTTTAAPTPTTALVTTVAASTPAGTAGPTTSFGDVSPVTVVPPSVTSLPPLIPPGQLPQTGSDVASIVGYAALLLAAGIAVLTVRRSRRSTGATR